MLTVKNKSLTTYAGDSNKVAVPLINGGVGVSDWSDYELTFSAKTNADDDDEDAVFQKITGIGLSVVGRHAVLDVVADDTEGQEGNTLYCGIRGQHTETGAKHVFADFLWVLKTAATQTSGASVPINTDEPVDYILDGGTA